MVFSLPLSLRNLALGLFCGLFLICTAPMAQAQTWTLNANNGGRMSGTYPSEFTLIGGSAGGNSLGITSYTASFDSAKRITFSWEVLAYNSSNNDGQFGWVNNGVLQGLTGGSGQKTIEIPRNSGFGWFASSQYRFTAMTIKNVVIEDIAPIIESVSSVRLSGGTATITGNWFYGASEVTLDGRSVTFQITDQNKISMTVPPSAAKGAFTVKVTTPGGSATGTMNYVDDLTLTGPLAPELKLTEAARIQYEAKGGDGVSTFAMTGTLPPGLSSSTDGAFFTISGTPTRLGDYQVDLKASNAASNQTVTATIRLKVTAPALNDLQNGAKTFTVGQTIDQAALAADGGVSPYSFSITPALPNDLGLTFDTSDGHFKGTATRTLAKTTYQVRVTDAVGQTKTADVELTVTKGTISLQLAASTMTPRHGDSVTLTATLTPNTATGQITFKNGGKDLGTIAAVSGKASITIARISARETYAIQAIYSGDERWNGVASAVINLTTPQRPDPANDPKVRAILATQASSLQQVTSMQMDQVHRRLETLHSDDQPDYSHGISFGMMQALASPDPASSVKPITGDLPNSGQISTQPLPQPEKDRTSAVLFSAQQPFRFWTSGSVMFGNTNVTALGETNRTHLTISGVTIGVDTKLVDNVKAGFAFSLSAQRATIGTDTSDVKSRAITSAAYASWKLTPHVFIDGLIGYGEFNLDHKRMSDDAGTTLSGSRRGQTLFTSVAASYEWRLDQFKFAPYARFDLLQANLGKSTETGDPAWTLTFDSQNFSSHAAVLGLRTQYDIAIGDTIISPMGRFEYRQISTSGLQQSLGYSDEPDYRSSIAMTASMRNQLNGTLGMRIQTGQNVASFEYMLSGTTQAGVSGQGMRATLQSRF